MAGGFVSDIGGVRDYPGKMTLSVFLTSPYSKMTLMAPPRTLVLFILLASYLSSPATSLRFDLQSGHTKCIAEDIRINAMSVGKFTVVNPSSVPSHEGYLYHHHQQEQKQQNHQTLPESHKLTTRVTSPHGNKIHLSEGAETGDFAFTASEEGDYVACFSAPDHKPTETITVEFVWRSGVAAKDWPSVAKKGQIDIMSQDLKMMEEIIKSIEEEMFYLREREEEMQDLNRSTNSRMAWLSFLSLSICMSVAGLQLWHLKHFFEKKKLI